jgi:hypothetical protein
VQPEHKYSELQDNIHLAVPQDVHFQQPLDQCQAALRLVPSSVKVTDTFSSRHNPVS